MSGFNFGSYNGGEDDDDAYNFEAEDDFNMAAQFPPANAAVPSINPTTGFNNPARMPTGRATGMNGKDFGRPPMTSVGAAGYQSKTSGFDPMGLGAQGPAPPLEEKTKDNPEEQAKVIEREVHEYIENSAAAAREGDLSEALSKAKDAGRKYKSLYKFRDSKGLEQSLDLEYAVSFNVAVMQEKNEMYSEAIHSYTQLVKNHQFPNSNRLRVNLGNIYFKQGNYTLAHRNYRMALDTIQTQQNKEIRFRIMQNIAICCVKLGQYHEAMDHNEEVMENSPTFTTGFNLLICCYVSGDTDKMKQAFLNLLDIPLSGNEEDDEELEDDDDDAVSVSRDILKEDLKRRQRESEEFISRAARLVAPVLDKSNWVKGFDWVIEQLQRDHDNLAAQLLICKASHHLRKKQYDQAITVLKSFEKKDHALKTMAATNLSFLYFLEGDVSQAHKYADMAYQRERYNAKVLVNKGNCLFHKGELEHAKELFLEAIGVEADCVEAIYNLGLVNKELGVYGEALQAFEKLNSIVPHQPEVIYQLANIHEETGKLRLAAKYYNALISRLPSDPNVLNKLGKLYSADEDENQSFHYNLESYRHYPVNLDVVAWLGIWYVKNEMYEKAIEFFQRAAEIEPNEVKWKLMVTSCYRRMNSYQKALELYQEIYEKHPENEECLKYMVAIMTDLGEDYSKYERELIALQRQTQGGEGLVHFDEQRPSRHEPQMQQQQQQLQQQYSAPIQQAPDSPEAPIAPEPARVRPKPMKRVTIDEDANPEPPKRTAPKPAPQRVRPAPVVKAERPVPAPVPVAHDSDDDEFADADLDDLLAD
eukprot:TRINITY_DN566_c0_g1_i1.p1 TRINITY_DN566_c0_g1~~TRINITY_DN566_c0_g1_i1.p1  ORF type:complete len:815 (-),score=313.08 TRINITY_DN566_c0_g1_i1:164-2608(-)